MGGCRAEMCTHCGVCMRFPQVRLCYRNHSKSNVIARFPYMPEKCVLLSVM